MVYDLVLKSYRFSRAVTELIFVISLVVDEDLIELAIFSVAPATLVHGECIAQPWLSGSIWLGKLAPWLRLAGLVKTCKSKFINLLLMYFII